jgi:hypothetical protein
VLDEIQIQIRYDTNARPKDAIKTEKMRKRERKREKKA